MPQYYCKTCGRTMDANQFYISRRVDRYPPDGHFHECKKCLTRHVNNDDPSTYLWILQEADVPYIEFEWQRLLDRYGKDRSKLTGTTILGRYLAKMKLNQYKEYHWDDNQRIKDMADAAAAESMQLQGYSPEEIDEVIKQEKEVPTVAERPPEPEPPPKEAAPETAPAADSTVPIDLLTPEYFDDDLTEEDKKYLSIKWGRAYKPYEWVQLEQYYADMTNAFDIQTPAHIDYLKLICKTSLKCHQLLDLGDVDGFQKMSRTYDMLMKSAKFTAAQNKDETGEYVNAVGEIVRIAEQEGFIPRFYVDKPQDKVDETIQDMRGYVDTLVRDELNLGNLIEGAVRAMNKEEEKAEEDEEDEILTDEDFTSHYDFIEEESAEDAAILKEIAEKEGY